MATSRVDAARAPEGRGNTRNRRSAQVAMEAEIAKAGLQNVPGFHKKVIQMFDIFNIRFGADSA